MLELFSMRCTGAVAFSNGNHVPQRPIFFYYCKSYAKKWQRRAERKRSDTVRDEEAKLLYEPVCPSLTHSRVYILLFIFCLLLNNVAFTENCREFIFCTSFTVLF